VGVVYQNLEEIMRKLTVEKLDDLDIVLNVTRAMFDSKGKLHVIVKQFEESFTDEQKGYYFVLCGIIGAELGNSKDEQHQYFKERFSI